MSADVDHKPLTQAQLDNYETRELRRWCIEHAIGAAAHGLVNRNIVAAADEFEQYVLNGKPTKRGDEPNGNR